MLGQRIAQRERMAAGRGGGQFEHPAEDAATGGLSLTVRLPPIASETDSAMYSPRPTPPSTRLKPVLSW